MEPLDLHEPWLVAAWPGMGAVGLAAVTHLAKGLGARPFGELGTREFFDVTKLAVKDGVFQPARRPRAWLLGWKAPPGRGRDLLLLLGEAQPEGQGWSFAEAVMTAARDLGVKRVVTFAAMATSMEARAPSRVFVAASDDALLDEVRRCELKTLEEGEISGLNGLLIGAGAAAGIPGLCLLAEFPYYAKAFPNPKASLAILEAFRRLSGVEVDVAALETQAHELEEAFDELQEHARELASTHRGEVANGGGMGEEEPGPGAATKARLDTLFEGARSDRAKALELKAELDRLGLFREYEDRFLDLFRQGG